MAKSFRLFVGNIPQGTSEEELRTEFGAYGVVESVEVKTKANALSGTADTFGFVSLKTEDRIVTQCKSPVCPFNVAQDNVPLDCFRYQGIS